MTSNTSVRSLSWQINAGLDTVDMFSRETIPRYSWTIPRREDTIARECNYPFVSKRALGVLICKWNVRGYGPRSRRGRSIKGIWNTDVSHSCGAVSPMQLQLARFRKWKLFFRICDRTRRAFFLEIRFSHDRISSITLQIRVKRKR